MKGLCWPGWRRQCAEGCQSMTGLHACLNFVVITPRFSVAGDGKWRLLCTTSAVPLYAGSARPSPNGRRARPLGRDAAAVPRPGAQPTPHGGAPGYGPEQVRVVGTREYREVCMSQALADSVACSIEPGVLKRQQACSGVLRGAANSP